jgi:hypothetical protein
MAVLRARRTPRAVELIFRRGVRRSYHGALFGLRPPDLPTFKALLSRPALIEPTPRRAQQISHQSLKPPQVVYRRSR